jgi:phenylpropionate dioxygenase-like ring-hydroxylating dioxygenase large terminal subunit
MLILNRSYPQNSETLKPEFISMTKSITPPIGSLGLPGYYYEDNEVFAHEMRTLWRSTWQCVGREEALPNPGDYLTCVIGNQPLFVIRDASGELQAMHNVCPHRGARLLYGQGNCSLVRCPYHGWTFDLEGKLQGIRQAKLFPDLDKSKVRLLSAQVDTWGGFIFVNCDSQGESLMSYLAGFPEYLKQYEQPWEELRLVMNWSYSEPINWKFIVENYVEDYHFSPVHAESLRSFDFQGISTTTTGRHCEIRVPYTAEALASKYSALTLEPQSLSYQGYIFPNLMVNTGLDHVSVFRLLPLSPVSTHIEVLIYQTKAQMEAFPLDPDAFQSKYHRVMEEDFAVCRLLQANVHSLAYGVTKLAEERELGITHFYKVLSEYLEVPKVH